MKKRNTLIAPNIVTYGDNEIEYSVHKVSASLVPEILPCLPAVGKEKMSELLLIPTFQKCECPVIEFTAEASKEKDRLLEVFYNFAKEIRTAVENKGYWCDYVDPTTGYPSVRGACPYAEVSAMESLLPYSTIHVGTSGGGCSMLNHPHWGLSCYPATLFALCPQPVLSEIIADVTKPS
eukprot:TRINITY_DN13203_c1_g1_i1.p1 TRINITY_DN13203_c1_g1~~TRINITY_DN13203_c1_g1_i1.p1  ORF type:complete len:179 (+),score=27.90 TRINITY_DN13203_c1_g1_i1:40-576(+)